MVSVCPIAYWVNLSGSWQPPSSYSLLRYGCFEGKRNLIEHNKDVSGSPAASDGILPFPVLLCDSRLHLLSCLFFFSQERKQLGFWLRHQARCDSGASLLASLCSWWALCRTEISVLLSRRVWSMCLLLRAVAGQEFTGRLFPLE